MPKENVMATTRPGAPQEEIQHALAERARALWGIERAEELRESLETTASQLEEVGRVLPKPDVEPGFYQ